MPHDLPYVVKEDNLVFALDVGTRTVVGVVCYPEENNLRVLEIESREHPQRDMIDGQIHNIEGVSQTVQQVKQLLEERLKLKLKKVSVAAAGRALETVKVRAGKDIPSEHRINAREISQLELEGAEKARQKLSKKNKTGNGTYYCVGYSTVQYLLDGHPISSLISQKGSYIEVEVLATFLPAPVVDSLLTVIENVDLTLHSLTLEPIAAMEVLIPPQYRHLNLALIDVGAGTSDIAITKRGSIIAYAMVPMAGDEVTEALADHYLMDFNSAEALKIEIAQQKPEHTLTDIIGNTKKVTLEEALEVIKPVIRQLSKKISRSITNYNKTSPRAIFCIGGGSQTPLLREELSKIMNIPLERVAIRNYDSLNRIINTGNILQGPECVTPFGIALSSLQEKFFGFSYVTVNGKVVRLLETEPTRVGKALLSAGYNPKLLIGLRGASLQVTVNDETKIFPGKTGENARIWANGKPANLETIVSPNDEMVVEPAQPGEKAAVTVGDLLEDKGAYIYIKGSRVYIPYRATVNGEPAAPEKLLSDGDRVEINKLGTLEELSQLTEIDFSHLKVTVNGKEVDLSSSLKPGDRVDWEE